MFELEVTKVVNGYAAIAVIVAGLALAAAGVAFTLAGGGLLR